MLHIYIFKGLTQLECGFFFNTGQTNIEHFHQGAHICLLNEIFFLFVTFEISVNLYSVTFLFSMSSVRKEHNCKNINDK